MDNIYLNVDTFNNLFDILKNKNSYVDTTDSKLVAMQKKKEQISTYIAELRASSVSNPETIKESEQILEIIDRIIIDIHNLKDNLSTIEKSILDLVLKKEDLSYSDTDLSENINKVKDEINTFEELSIKLNTDITEKYSIVKNYFNSNSVLKLDASLEDDELFDESKPAPKIVETVTISSELDEMGIQDNLTLRISEKNNKVFLPYTKEEIMKYLETYPEVFKDAKSVINREFIMDLTYFTRYSSLARFREVYSLIRNREMKTFLDALKRAFDLMFKYELNPAIVAGLKSESQLDSLLECIEKNTLDDFKPFKIIFEINPLKR